MKQPQERAKLSAEQWELLLSQMVQHGEPIGRVRTARRCVEAGLRLLVLKEVTPHGQFADHVNRLGIEVGTANKCMGAARRFRDAPDTFFDAIGSASKLLELLPLDDADALAQGHAVHGLTLDLVAQMTVKELRAAVLAAMVSKRSARTADWQSAIARIVPTQPTASNAPTSAHLPERERHTVRLNAEEERMLRRYRKCNAEGRAALLQVAGLLECGATTS